MPLVMTDEDKATVKRTIPKPANKIFAVAVAKLYVAHPNKQRWTFTGLQGAAVLAEDHVGHTLWIKLVDISQSNRGILWDQEIYDTFHYNQDRTFFHTFELENCLAGLSFVDEKEAKTFKKKMDDRESKASKATKATTFGSGVGGPGGHTATGGKSRFGIGSLLPGHRSSSGPHNPPPLYESSNQSLLPSQDFNRSRASSGSGIDLAWRPLFHELRATGMSEGEITKLFRELKDMGIKDEDIETQGDFVKEYVLNQAAANNQAMGNNSGSRPPAPPPPPPGGRPSISPQNTGSTTTSRRGPAPPPPPTRRSQGNHLSAGPHSPDPGSPDRESSPPRGPPAPRFRAPPPLADAGRFANTPPPAPPRSQAAASGGGPPPPPRPPKTPMEDEKPSRFGVPPPFQGERMIPSVAPPPPSRASAPAPSLPVRDRAPSHSVPPATNNPPPLPPKTPHGAPPPAAKSIAPPMPSRSSNPPLAPPLPSVTRPIPPPPSSSGPPPPPPMPSISGPPPPPPMPSSSGPPPPPPMPSSSGPPPPPPMPPSSSGPPAPPLPPGRDSGYISAASSAPPLPAASGDKADVMASIRASGGIGGGVLKKVDPSQQRDRSAAIVAGGSSDNAASGGSSAPPPPAAGGGSLADTLAQALKSRKSKVSQSDDEDDDDSDWDDTPKAKTKR